MLENDGGVDLLPQPGRGREGARDARGVDLLPELGRGREGARDARGVDLLLQPGRGREGARDARGVDPAENVCQRPLLVRALPMGTRAISRARTAIVGSGELLAAPFTCNRSTCHSDEFTGWSESSQSATGRPTGRSA